MWKPRFICGAALCLALSACATAPTQEMSDARLAFRAAQAAGADARAPVTLTQARRLLDTAQSRLEAGCYADARSQAVAARQAATAARQVADAMGRAQRECDTALRLNALSPTARDALAAAQAAAAHGDVDAARRLAAQATQLADTDINQAKLERAHLELSRCQTGRQGPAAAPLAAITAALHSHRGAAALALVQHACAP